MLKKIKKFSNVYFIFILVALIVFSCFYGSKNILYSEGLTGSNSNKLIDNNIDYFAVADFEEGIRLRSNGINSPIIILYPSKNNLKVITENNLEPTIYSEEMLSSIIQLAQNKVKIHIKIDSGMNRYGIRKNEVSLIIKKIKQAKNIVIGSVFSHLSSNNKEHRGFSMNQLTYFNNIFVDLHLLNN